AEKGAYLSFNSEKDYSQSFELARKWEESALTPTSRFDAQLMALRSAYQTNNSVAVGEYANKITTSGQASQEQVATANFYVGKMAYDKGDYARAYPALQSVTQKTTTEIMPEAYHLQAQILYKQRKYAQAAELIPQANQASAGYDDWIAKNLILLSDVYAEQGDKNSATAALEAVLENYKGNDASILATAREKYNRLNSNAPPPTNKGIKGSNFLELEEGGN
ncbi:MAG: hypothetical protein ABIQ93_12005, partial [Saprospiraceae bacterium]